MEGDVFVLNVRVTPRASRSEIVGFADGVLKARIAAPPVDGAANIELVKLLARTFGIPKGNIAIVSGETSRTKRVRLIGASETAIQQVLRA